MKVFAATTVAVLCAVPAFAQQVVTPETTAGVYMSAADVAAAVAKLPKNPLASVPVFKIGPFNVNVEHRLGAPAAAQAASVHDKDAELFFMMDGTATLVTGGKLVEGTKDGDNWRGKSIEGGKSQKMSKGDFMMVPAGVPHWFTDINGQITEFSLHLPVK
ncbi:MAG TPA: cupin domain-containing protein [Vicinamibacterales bacterium]|jgi:mannose-6-phosphate isomerase-like protein (cupin superfamily)